MPTISNAKHERFAQELAKGKTADEAYQEAGYKPDRGNASRLTANDSIRARVAEILGKAAIRAELTVAGITDKLLAIAEKAEKSNEAPMLSVARASYMDAAKINGLIVDRSESLSETVQRIISDRPQSDEEWAEAHGADMGAAAGTPARAH